MTGSNKFIFSQIVSPSIHRAVPPSPIPFAFHYRAVQNAFTASVCKCFIRDSIYFDFWGTVSPSKDIYDFLTFLLLLWALSSDIGAGPVLMYIAVGAL